MPDVAVYRATFGWQREAWCIPVGITAQRTLGGGDIRRQDMPFVSNRMNFTAAHAELMYLPPAPRRPPARSRRGAHALSVATSASPPPS